MVMAPFTPFLAEELYRKLTGGESVHLLDWPEVGHINELSLHTMAQTRQTIETGLSLRMQKSDTEDSIKVRQPLLKLTYTGEKLDQELEEIIVEEVNVKTVEFNPDSTDTVWIDKTLTPELKREGLMREIIRNVQNARKQAGLNVDDRIKLSLASDDPDMKQAIKEHMHTICDETLATSLVEAQEGLNHPTEVIIDDKKLHIALK